MHSKKVWYVKSDGSKFMSDKGNNNGKRKAIDHCLANMINTDNIIAFDSETEWKRYMFLLEQQKQGNIMGSISVHQQFVILPAFTTQSGREHEQIIYEADFVYMDIQGCTHVEDTKGFADDSFYLKWKMFDSVYGEMGMELDVIRLLPRYNYLDINAWADWSVKPEKKRSKKLKEENAELRKASKEADKEARQIARIKARYIELKAKPKLTKAESERLVQCCKYLAEKGIIIL